MEILGLLTSLLTPLVVLILGMKINKALEKTKGVMSRESDWQALWASKFLEVAYEYHTRVTEMVTGMSQVQSIEHSKRPGWEDESGEEAARVGHAMKRLTVLDWEIQSVVRFAPKHGPLVVNAEKRLHGLLMELRRTLRGDLEVIRQGQFEFDEAVRYAHAEILGLAPAREALPASGA